jgi:hypothetical protein
MTSTPRHGGSDGQKDSSESEIVTLLNQWSRWSNDHRTVKRLTGNRGSIFGYWAKREVEGGEHAQSRGAEWVDYELMERVDEAIRDLSRSHYLVILREYRGSPKSVTRKAQDVGVSVDWYKTLLNAAEKQLARALCIS